MRVAETAEITANHHYSSMYTTSKATIHGPCNNTPDVTSAGALLHQSETLSAVVMISLNASLAKFSYSAHIYLLYLHYFSTYDSMKFVCCTIEIINAVHARQFN